MTAPRRVGVVTTGRADFGIYQPVFAALKAHSELAPELIVSGDHVAEIEVSGGDHGLAAGAALAEAAGLPLGGVLPMPLGDGGAAAVGAAMARVTQHASALFSRAAPDILLVLGDRYEMHAVVVAASAHRVPVAHIHGGEESEGALDNLYRHAITKLSHLHFCATPLAERRLLAMGEEAWRVTRTGAPSLDGIDAMPLLDPARLREDTGLPDGLFLMATHHPETLRPGATADDLDEVVEALARLGLPTLFSRANADQDGQAINARLEAHAARHDWLILHASLGRTRYFSAMAQAAAMVGNSSSGIIEAASFGLPVVNVGGRQAGRERSANVVDVAPRAADIEAALRTALSVGRQPVANVYAATDPAGASTQIAAALAETALGPELLIKRFSLIG